MLMIRTFHIRILIRCVVVISSFQVVAAAKANETAGIGNNRAGYSLLGLGYEKTSFSEGGDFDFVSSGQLYSADVVGDYSSGNFAQRSLAYVAIDEKWGFYIGSGSTLSSIKNEERWEGSITHDSGVVVLKDIWLQTNTMTLSRGELSVLVSKRVQGKKSLLLGARYNSFSFKRYGFIFSDYISEDNQPDGEVSEESTAFLVQGGVEYNDFFTTKIAGWKMQVQLVLGFVLYNHVMNTAEDVASESFNETLNGFDVKAIFNFGYQFGEHFLLAGAVDAHYQSYNSISKTVTSSDGSRVLVNIPKSEFGYVQPSINVLWSF